MPLLVGHRHVASAAVSASNPHRPMDIRAAVLDVRGRVDISEAVMAEAGARGGRCWNAAAEEEEEHYENMPFERQIHVDRTTVEEEEVEEEDEEVEEEEEDEEEEAVTERRLWVGAAIAAEAREAVRIEAGLRCSAGIANNKLGAKLASGLHKPDDQTVLPPSQAGAYTHSLQSSA